MLSKVLLLTFIVVMTSCGFRIDFNGNTIAKVQSANRSGGNGGPGSGGSGPGSLLLMAKPNSDGDYEFSSYNFDTNSLNPPFLTVGDNVDGSKIKTGAGSLNRLSKLGFFPADSHYFIIEKSATEHLVYRTDGNSAVLVANTQTLGFQNGVEHDIFSRKEGAFITGGYYLFRGQLGADPQHDYWLTTGTAASTQKLLDYLGHGTYQAGTYFVSRVFPLGSGSKVMLLLNALDNGSWVPTSVIIADLTTKAVTTVTISAPLLTTLSNGSWGGVSDTAVLDDHYYLTFETDGIFHLDINAATADLVLPGVYRPMVYRSGSRVYMATVNKAGFGPSALYVINSGGQNPVEIYTHSGPWELYYNYNPRGEDGELVMFNNYDEDLAALISDGTAAGTFYGKISLPDQALIYNPSLTKVNGQYLIMNGSTEVDKKFLYTLSVSGGVLNINEATALNNKLATLIDSAGTQLNQNLSNQNFSASPVLKGDNAYFGYMNFPNLVLLASDGTVDGTVLVTDYSTLPANPQFPDYFNFIINAYLQVFADQARNSSHSILFAI